MKRAIIALFLISAVGVFILASCGNNTSLDTSSDNNTAKDDTVKYIKITAEEAKKKIDENENAIILDVRTESEFNEKHIENAVLIPNETIFDTMPEQLPDYDAEILIYCRSGNRSRQAALKLIEMGYTRVYDFGGIIDWPYDVDTSD